MQVLAQQDGIADAEISTQKASAQISRSAGHQRNDAGVDADRQQATEERTPPLAGGRCYGRDAPQIPKSRDRE